MVIAASIAAAAPPTIVTHGKGAAIACVSCHGVEGAGNAQAGFPVLAQLPPAYFAKQIADFKAGKEKALMSIVGMVMKASAGKANPAQVNEIVRRKIDAL